VTDSEGKAPIIVLLSKKVGTRATTFNTGSWRSLASSDQGRLPIGGNPTQRTGVTGLIENRNPQLRLVLRPTLLGLDDRQGLAADIIAALCCIMQERRSLIVG
jgi:hypothetical protein